MTPALRKTGSFASPVFILLTAACSFIADLAHMEAPAVLSFSPAAEFLCAEDLREISVRFSAEMRTAVTEEAFSLRRDGASVPGAFAWDGGGKIMVFRPLAPFEDRRTYTATIGSGSEDRYGNSLPREYARTFHTRRELDTPRVLSSSPPAGSRVTDPRNPVRLLFSEPMDPADTMSAFSLSPSLPGWFSWESGMESFLWTPLEDYVPGKVYRVTLGKNASDTSGNCLPEDHVFQFAVPGENPAILSVATLDGRTTLSPAGDGDSPHPSGGIEKDEKFLVCFSRPVPPEERTRAVVTIPSLLLETEWREEGRELVLGFSEYLGWRSTGELHILDTVYRFIVDGENSVPLEISRVFYDDEELLFAHNYPFPSSSGSAFDVYVSHGEGAAVVLASFLSAFSIRAGNGCVYITPTRVEMNPPAPAPRLPVPDRETLFRVHCEVVDMPVPGTVELIVDTELRDDRDNRPQNKFVLEVNKQ